MLVLIANYLIIFVIYNNTCKCFYVIIYSNISYFLQGTPCDLLTGEERKYAKGPEYPSNHLSCSVEMVDLQKNCRYNFVIFHNLQHLYTRIIMI